MIADGHVAWSNDNYGHWALMVKNVYNFRITDDHWRSHSRHHVKLKYDNKMVGGTDKTGGLCPSSHPNCTYTYILDILYLIFSQVGSNVQKVKSKQF